MRGEAAAAIVHQDEWVVGFRDARPVAPTHILIVPRQHVASVQDLKPAHAELVGRMILAAREIAMREGVDSGGYRLVLNTGSDAGQSVFHIHLHLLAGRRMHWPPG